MGAPTAPGVQQPLRAGQVERLADADPDRAAPRGACRQAAATCVWPTSPSPARCTARQAAALEGPTYSCTALRGPPCQHCTSPRRAAGLRERSQATRGRQPVARELDRPHRRRARLAEARGLGRAGGAVVVVAHQRYGAALARARHHVLGVRTPADHVPERPQLLRAGRLGRGDHRVERLRVGVRVAEHRHEHGTTLSFAALVTIDERGEADRLD